MIKGSGPGSFDVHVSPKVIGLSVVSLAVDNWLGRQINFPSRACTRMDMAWLGDID